MCALLCVHQCVHWVSFYAHCGHTLCASKCVHSMAVNMYTSVYFKHACVCICVLEVVEHKTYSICKQSYEAEQALSKKKPKTTLILHSLILKSLSSAV